MFKQTSSRSCCIIFLISFQLWVSGLQSKNGTVATAAPEGRDSQAAATSPGALPYVLRYEDYVDLDLFGDSWEDADEHWGEPLTPRASGRVVGGSQTAQGKAVTDVQARNTQPRLEVHHVFEDKHLAPVERDGDAIDIAASPKTGGPDTPTETALGASEVVLGESQEESPPAPLKSAPATSVSELYHKFCSHLARMGRAVKVWNTYYSLPCVPSFSSFH